jgi:hypothetical protein
MDLVLVEELVESSELMGMGVWGPTLKTFNPIITKSFHSLAGQ